MAIVNSRSKVASSMERCAMNHDSSRWRSGSGRLLMAASISVTVLITAKVNWGSFTRKGNFSKGRPRQSNQLANSRQGEARSCELRGRHGGFVLGRMGSWELGAGSRTWSWPSFAYGSARKERRASVDNSEYVIVYIFICPPLSGSARPHTRA